MDPATRWIAMSTYIDEQFVIRAVANGLNQDSVAALHVNGYFHFHSPVFTSRQFSHLQDRFLDYLDIFGEEDLEGVHLRDGQVVGQLTSDSVMRCLVPLLGPNIGIFDSRFDFTPAFAGRACRWRRGSTPVLTSEPDPEKMVTIWIAIERSFEANGAMVLKAGTHRDAKGAGFESAIGSIRREYKDVVMNLDPNECSFYSPYILQFHRENGSPYPRAGLSVTYFSTDIHLNIDDPRNGNVRPILALGRDIGGNRYVSLR